MVALVINQLGGYTHGVAAYNHRSTATVHIASWVAMPDLFSLEAQTMGVAMLRRTGR